MAFENLIHSKSIAQTKEIAWALTFCGGFIDAYTYIQRGHTLAAGQTGNIIFFSASLANGNIIGMINRLSTILAFIFGLMVVTVIHSHTQSRYWRIFEMIPIMIICAVVSFLPKSVPDYYVVPALAIGLAMQNGAFKKIEGLGYSNAFTSGNLKKTVIAWSEYYFDKDIDQREPARNYTVLVLAFASGAIISASFQKIIGSYTLLIATALLALINAFYGYMVYKRHKEWENRKKLSQKR
ncbi:YoaK family protein [Lactobacillus sp. PSON]|uniref:YoaK family protein n=1 Tax=Lactobacillus sp. PSON TaxID=3455454 RepID=UPI0040437D0F